MTDPFTIRQASGVFRDSTRLMRANLAGFVSDLANRGTMSRPRSARPMKFKRDAQDDGESESRRIGVRRRSGTSLATPSDRPSRGRRMVTAALLVAMMVTAVEQLVVSPAMPTIIAQLKGFEIYPWVISAYLLAATVSTPIYGKLADLFGRKRVLLFGLVLFSAGLGPLGHVAEHGTVDRDADDPGPGRRRGRADRADDAGRPVHAQGAGAGPGALQRRLGPLERRRAARSADT